MTIEDLLTLTDDQLKALHHEVYLDLAEAAEHPESEEHQQTFAAFMLVSMEAKRRWSN